jgi:broad specificity phosphatase PhoE
MSDTDIRVWFLRHGKTPFDYENSRYDDFIQMLCNGRKTPLAEDPKIDFKSLPKQVDFVGYSRFTRALETAKLLRNELDVKQMEEMPVLHEVRFDKDIISENEFESLEQIRPMILERWYHNKNKAESFKNSLARVRKIESFLSKRQEKTVILVTHGWFLRLLEIHFVLGKRIDDITLEDILKVKPVPLGHFIKAKVARESRVESQDLDGDDILAVPLSRRQAVWQGKSPIGMRVP